MEYISGFREPSLTQGPRTRPFLACRCRLKGKAELLESLLYRNPSINSVYFAPYDRFVLHGPFRTPPDFADVTTNHTYSDVVGEFRRSLKRTVFGRTWIWLIALFRLLSQPRLNSPTTSIPKVPQPPAQNLTDKIIRRAVARDDLDDDGLCFFPPSQGLGRSKGAISSNLKR